MRVKKSKKIKKVEALSLSLILSVGLTACGGSKSADLSKIRKIEQSSEASETKRIEIETEKEIQKEVETEKEIENKIENEIKDNNYSLNRDIENNDDAIRKIVDDILSLYVDPDSPEISVDECEKIVDDTYSYMLGCRKVPLITIKGAKYNTQDLDDSEQVYSGYGSYYESSTEQVLVKVERNKIVSCKNKLTTKMDGDFVSCILEPLEEVPEDSPFRLETFNNTKESSLNVLFNELGFSVGDLLENGYEIEKGYKMTDGSNEYGIVYIKNRDKHIILAEQNNILIELNVLVPYGNSEMHSYNYHFSYKDLSKDDYFLSLTQYLSYQFCMCNSLTDTVRNIWDARLSEDDKLELGWDDLIADQDFYLENARGIADILKDNREQENKTSRLEEETKEASKREETEEVLENSSEPWRDHSKNQVYIDKYGYKAYPLSYYANDNIDGLEDLYNQSIDMFNSELNTTVDYMFYNDLDVDIDTSLEDSTKIYEPGETAKVVGIIHQFSEKYDDFVHVYFIINLKNTENIGVAMRDMCIVGLDSPDNY